MNRREELNMMILRAQINAQERLKEIAVEWAGSEPVEANAPKPYEDRSQPAIAEEQDGIRKRQFI